MWARLALGLALLAAAGCGSKVKYAPVSGKVTLNGKPLAGAQVSFQPIAPAGSANAAAAGSSGKTNANGEYTLTVSTGETGAWVGKHKVMISAWANDTGESDARPPRGGWPQKDLVPKKYNSETTLERDVPGGGGTINFELTSP
jgi:hypothetical protein